MRPNVSKHMIEKEWTGRVCTRHSKDDAFLLDRHKPGWGCATWPRNVALVVSMVALGVGAAPARVAHARTISVPCDSKAPGLIDAITIADSGDDVVLDQNCTYTLTAVDNSTDGGNGLPVVKKTITIVGNGATITRTAAAPKFRILEVVSGGDLTLNNVTVENGDAAGGNFKTGRGGGVYNLGTLKVVNSTFSHNSATFGGGGIGNGDAQETTNPNPAGGTLTVVNSTFSKNKAGEAGGGIASGANSKMTLTDCTISSNKGGFGVASQGQATLKNCDVTLNVDGGIVNAGLMFLENNTVIKDNPGIGIFNNNDGTNRASLFLTSSAVIHNQATNGAGIVNSPAATATLINSAVNNNIATNDGGGIANTGSIALISSVVSGNSAANDGGGIDNAVPLPGIFATATTFATVTLTGGSVVSGNSAGHEGGGIVNKSFVAGTFATATLTGSTVSGNTASASPTSGGGIFNQSSTTSTTNVDLDFTAVTGNGPNNCTNVVVVVNPLCI